VLSGRVLDSADRALRRRAAAAFLPRRFPRFDARKKVSLRVACHASMTASIVSRAQPARGTRLTRTGTDAPRPTPHIALRNAARSA